MGDSDFILRARRLRKALGGSMRQAGILASAGVYALDHMIDRLEEDHINAGTLAKELYMINHIEIDLNKVSTNLVFFNLSTNKMSDDEFIDKLLTKNIKIDSKGNHQFRMATHFGFINNDIEKVIKAIKFILSK